MVKFWRCRPHRLVAQDVALSRPKQGFESPWGHQILAVSHLQAKKTLEKIEGLFIVIAGLQQLKPRNWFAFACSQQRRRRCQDVDTTLARLQGCECQPPQPAPG